jgi:hypothetical protein
MTVAVVEQTDPLLHLAFVDRPERAAESLPVDDHGFHVLVLEAHPDLEYATQRRSDHETVHVWRDRWSGEYSVYVNRDSGGHGVWESGFPWHDRLTSLAEIWEATVSPVQGGAR